MNKMLFAAAAALSVASPIALADRRREAELRAENLRKLIAEAERNGQKVIVVDGSPKEAEPRVAGYDTPFAEFLTAKRGRAAVSFNAGFGDGIARRYTPQTTPEIEAKMQAGREADAKERQRKAEAYRQRKELRKGCPKCHGKDVEWAHHQGTFAVPECDFIRCNNCEHQWGHQ